MSQERTHAKFSPSRSEQFFLCRGAPNLLARTPARPSTTYSEEGNIAHAILEAGLLNNSPTATEAMEHTEYGFGVLEALYEYTIIKNIAEFKASINAALDYVQNLIDEIDLLYGAPELYVEVRVDPPIASAPGEAAGYCDIAIYSPVARKLWVMDYKHGAGIAKPVKDNTQVKQYAAGFLYDPASPVDKNFVDSVTLVIIQPRAFHVDGDIREHTVTPAELADYLIELDEVIAECLEPDAPLKPGTEQCRFCDAASTCPARERAALAVASMQFSSVKDLKGPSLPVPEGLDVARLGYIYQHKDMLYKWLSDVESHIYALQMSGINVPGTKLVEADARREWFGDEDDRATKLMNLTGLPKEEFYRTKFKTLTEVEEMVTASFKARVSKADKKEAAQQAKKMFAYFTSKQSSGKLTLVTEDDKRPPANRAITAFRNVSILPPNT